MGSAKVGSDGTNSLDKKNLLFTDYNSKNRESFNEGISNASTKCKHNLTPVNFTNGANHRVIQECNQSKKRMYI